jgi:DNA-binding MarR family transcriptional regulator
MNYARPRTRRPRGPEAPPGPSALPEQVPRTALIARITDLAPAVRKVFEVHPAAEERGTWMSLTAHQLEALSALSGSSLTMGELCERLDISESAGTALSDRLVSRGMVVRGADPSDRRVVRLSLSDEARAMVERFRELKRSRIAEVLTVLDDAELEMLARVYERLLASSPGCGRSGRDRRDTGPTAEQRTARAAGASPDEERQQ